MALSEEKYAAGEDGLRRVLRQWDLPGDARLKGDLLDSWLESVQRGGWTRKDVYRLVEEILDESPSQFSQATWDDLLEFETGLTGYCHVDSITRFPNEPVDADQLLEYVRGNHWR